jgi:hypothetical protein
VQYFQQELRPWPTNVVDFCCLRDKGVCVCQCWSFSKSERNMWKLRIEVDVFFRHL